MTEIPIQSTKAAYTTALIFAILVGPLILADGLTLNWFRSVDLPGDLVKLIEITEAFAHGFGVILILLAVWLLDPLGRVHFPLLIAATIGTAIPVHFLKRFIGRMRPSAMATAENFEGSFFGICPWLDRGTAALSDASIQSFPSGHAALAVALAWGLATRYPQARWYFATLAFGAGMQRVISGAHFPSDVVAGAAIGSLTFAVCSDPKLFGRWLRRS